MRAISDQICTFYPEADLPFEEKGDQLRQHLAQIPNEDLLELYLWVEVRLRTTTG